MISAALRRTVRTLYGFACGYCGVSETEVGAALTVDHFVPQDAGGSDAIENLVYACHACNLHKSASYNEPNPSVLHPLRSDINLHFRLLPDSTLEGLTPEGRRHIETLHLNRPPLVEHRKLRRLIEILVEQEKHRLQREKKWEQEARRKTRLIRRKRRQSR